jgi:hypothetical protein
MFQVYVSSFIHLLLDSLKICIIPFLPDSLKICIVSFLLDNL